MKNLKFVFTALLAVLLFSCNQDNVVLEKPIDNAFMNLVQEGVYPINRLSEASIKHFNESIIIKDGDIVSGNFGEILKELTETEMQLLFDLMYGQEVLFVSDETELPTLEEGTLELRRCQKIVRIHYFTHPTGCMRSFGHFCADCIKMHD